MHKAHEQGPTNEEAPFRAPATGLVVALAYRA